MLKFGWNEFDPTEGSATSIDPLKSLAYSVQLGDLVFPGTSGRVWRIRYMSALCYLLRKAELEKEADYRTNYLHYRKYENAFILCLFVLRKRFAEMADFRRVIGLDKAETLAKSNPGAISIIGDILANQMNLGPLGVHSVLMKDLGLIEDDRELLLLPAGEKLADRFEQAVGKDSQEFLSQISNRTKNVKTEGFEQLSEKMLFEFKHDSQSNERKSISSLLFSNSTRRQLFTDLLAISKGTEAPDELGEAQLIDAVSSISSPLKSRYEVIAAYEQFQRIFHHYFDVIRNVPKDEIRFKLENNKRLLSGFNSIKAHLADALLNLRSKGDQFLESNDDPGGTVQEVMRFSGELGASMSDYVHLTEFTVKFHERHQQDKGKMPWIRLSAQYLEVAPRYAVDDQLPSLAEVKGRNIHNYRLSNCVKMITDMGMEQIS